VPCKQCHAEKTGTFSGEVAIHFPGLNGLKKPILWVFPDLVVCLHCGFTEFTVAANELSVLVTGILVTGVAISESG